jgi:hypothetical protein
VSGTLPSEGLTPGGEAEVRAPLRPSLSLRDGRVYVILRDVLVAPGVRLVGLDLEVPDVDFPVELRGGVARYQHHKTRVVSAALVVEPAVLGAALGRRLPLEGPLSALSLHPDAGTFVTEARLWSAGGAARVRERARHVVLPGRGRTLRLLPVEVVRVGGSGVPADVVAQALSLIVAGAPGGRALAPELDARGVLTLDALAATLWAVLPPAGWKLPAHDGVGPARVYTAADGALVVAYGPDPQDVRLPAEDVVAGRAALLAQAREDALALVDDEALAPAAGSSVAHRFATLRAGLDARLGPTALLERALVLGASDPALAVDLADLVADVLALEPGHAVALALRADLAEARGEHRAAQADRARAAEAFERGGRPRLAGFVHLAAAERAQGLERTQALEAALAVLGEDPEVLRALVEAHVAARQPTAVGLAKRLARAASRPAERAWAHVAAGDVLRSVLAEPIAAKREYERALLVDPDDGAALEGLAQALITQGDPRRAAAILERLFARAMAGGDKARAAALSVSLGDLWLGLDAGAAVARWKRATELDPEHLPAIERLARAAAEVSDEAVALDAGERALALGRRALELMPAGLERALRLRAARLAVRTPSRRAEALAHLEALLARTPDDDEALAELRTLAGSRASTLAAALGRAGERCLVRGELERAAGFLAEEAQAWGIGAGRVTVLDEAARAALLARAEALLAQRPGDGVALDVVVALDPRPAARVRALRARLTAASTPRERAQLALQLARALVDDGEARAALELAATAVAHGLPASTWLELASALRDTAVAAEVPRLLARVATHATPGEVVLLARAEAEAREHAGDLAGAYEARTRAELGSVDELAEVARLAMRLDRHVEARGWLARWEARLGDDREARLRWLAASADAGLAAGDADGEIAALEQLLDLLVGGGPLGIAALGHGATTATSAVEAHADAVATRLASRLELAGRSRALARLERRRATELGAPIVVAIPRALAAAEAWARVGEDDEAVRDLSRVLEWGASLPLASAQVGEALDALERLARRRGDVRRIVDALDRRARFVVGAEARARVRLEQAEALAAAGAPAEAIARLAQARTELPRSRSIAARLAREAKRQGLLELWAEAEAHLAALADDEGDRAAALEQHAVAADALAETGRMAEAARHDRTVVERGVLGDLPLERVHRSLRRLERHARTTHDDTLLDEVLDRWAELEPPVAAVERLYEKAELELARHGATERAVNALRRARARAEDDVPRARELDARIADVLTQLERWDELAAHAVARGDRAEGPRRAAAYLEAARVLDERLGQGSAALERTRAALEADPTNPAGRALRRRLLRETARGVELAEALLEDARATAPGEEQASLRLEAADLLAPLEGEGTPSSTAAVVRALEISRDVARVAPRLAAPHRRVAAYARLLARFDEEYVALGRLAEVTDDPVERAVAVWRRVELARGPLEDPVGAQAELYEVIQTVEGLDAERAERLAEQLDRTPSIVRPEDVPSPLDALLALGTALTAETRDHETHLRYLARQLERAPDARARADLHFRIGETREWKQGDGDAAERAYLAALRELPEHERGRKALRGLYLAVDRFGDLAEHLGIDELLSLWTELGQSFAGERQIAAGEALWPRLPRGSAERAKVLLATADLYRTVRDEAEGAVMLLELVTREGPVEFEPAALERLRVLFLEEGRNDLYVEILRRQADRAEGDAARARALAEVGEALEWKLGDGAGAELEYRTALAVDPSCGLARERLGLLLASQDRFAELAADLGVDTLEREALALATRGRREGERLVRAADVLTEVLPEARRAALWGELIEREPDPELRRKLLSYGPVSGLGRPAEAPPAWDEPSGATHLELPVMSREDAEGEGARRPRLPVKLTVVADPLADVVRLVPRLHDVSSGGSAASLSAVPSEASTPGEVVPLNRDESVPPDFALVREDEAATRVFAPTMLAPAGERSWEVSVEPEGTEGVDGRAADARSGGGPELGLVGEAGGARGLVGEPSGVRSARDAEVLAGEARESLGLPASAPSPRVGDGVGEAWGVRGLVDPPEPLEGEAAWDAVMARVPPEGALLEVPSMIEDAREAAEPSASEVASVLEAVREAAAEAEAERAEAEVLRASEVVLRASERARAHAEEAHAGDMPSDEAAAREVSDGERSGDPAAAPEASAPAPGPQYRRYAARSADSWASWGPTDAARLPPLPARTLPSAEREGASPEPSERSADAALPPQAALEAAAAPADGTSPAVGAPSSVAAPVLVPTSTRWLGLARRAAEGDARAEALLRRGAARWPLVREALVALGSAPARALVAAAWPEDAAGAALVPLSAGPHAPAGWRRLAAEALAQPLSALLARAAMPVAAVLPPRGEDVTARQPLDPDSALARALPALCRALDLELVAERDGAARGVHLEPGEPPALIVGADVADDLRGTYLLARAAMRLRLGALLADAPDVHAWVRTLLRLTDIQPGEDPAATLLRARLGPAGLMDLEAAVAQLPRDLERGAVEAWMSGTRHQASLFAAAWVGSPAPLLAEAEVERPGLLRAWTGAALEQWIASVRSES